MDQELFNGQKTSASEYGVKTQDFSQDLRGRSTNAFLYEAQVEFIRKKHGDLDSIRRRLGLSRRKVCQLLLVDPSAWTRWTKPDSDAPPHIYRALEWYLLLQEKYPGMDSPFWLESVARPARERVSLETFRKESVQLRARLRIVQWALIFTGILTTLSLLLIMNLWKSF